MGEHHRPFFPRAHARTARLPLRTTKIKTTKPTARIVFLISEYMTLSVRVSVAARTSKSGCSRFLPSLGFAVCACGSSASLWWLFLLLPTHTRASEDSASHVFSRGKEASVSGVLVDETDHRVAFACLVLSLSAELETRGRETLLAAA